jgi:hypothetical protein
MPRTLSCQLTQAIVSRWIDAQPPQEEGAIRPAMPFVLG